MSLRRARGGGCGQDQPGETGETRTTSGDRLSNVLRVGSERRSALNRGSSVGMHSGQRSPPIRQLSLDEYKRELPNVKLVVHIAGKGNLPEPGAWKDKLAGGEYSQYEKNWRIEPRNTSDMFDKSFEKQSDLRTLLNPVDVAADCQMFVGEVEAEVKARGGTLQNVVFTFDGDNYQSNSPFTIFIKLLIIRGLVVYAFKKRPPPDQFGKIHNHLTTWVDTARTPYSGLVLMDNAPSTYTASTYDWYLSYGMPLFVSRGIRQPQKDSEIVDGKADKFGREMIDASRPGLVESSMVTEYKTLLKAPGSETTNVFVIPSSLYPEREDFRATLVKRARK